MPSLQEIRSQYPQYKDLSDQQLADGLYKKFYSDMPREDFNSKIGSSASQPEKPQDLSLAKGALETVKDVGKSALIGLPATLYQEIRHPIDSAKTLYGGIKTIPDAEKAAAKNAFSQVREDVAAVQNPELSNYQRALRGGRSILGAAGMIANAGIGVPYQETFGALANKGSGGRVSREEAAIVPMMAASAGPTKMKLSEFGEAANRMKMDLTKRGPLGNLANENQIAQEISRATDAHDQRLVDQIAPRSPTQKETGQLGETAQSALRSFQKRKDLENKSWIASEQRGEKVPIDAKPVIEKLNGLKEKVLERLEASEDTPDVKKAKAVIDRVLGEIGVSRNSIEPARQANAGDLARAHRAVNEDAYDAADPRVHQDVKAVLKEALSQASKQDKDFATAWRKANSQTMKNADVYRSDQKAAKFGFDEKTLKRVGDQISQNRPVAASDLEKINAGTDEIKTPEDILFLKRSIPNKANFAMAMRAKAAAMLYDIGTDANKLKEQRPFLEKVFEEGGADKKAIKRELDDRMTVAKQMQKFKLPSKPEAEELGPKSAAKRVASIGKALFSFSTKYRLWHGANAIFPGVEGGRNLGLKALQEKAQPFQATPLRNVTGPAIGAFLGSQNQGNQ